MPTLDQLPPRPDGLTAEVARTPEGTRIVLRPRDAGRWGGVVFGFAGLAALLGMVGAMGAMVLRLTGLHRVPLAVALRDEPIMVAALLLMLPLTGAVFAYNAYRIGYVTLFRAAGEDMFVVTPAGFRLSRRLIVRHATRFFRPGELVAITARPNVLFGHDGRRRRMLTHLGTQQDRRWLREVLVGAINAELPRPPRLDRGPRVPPPEGWDCEPLLDGGVRLRLPAELQRFSWTAPSQLGFELLAASVHIYLLIGHYKEATAFSVVLLTLWPLLIALSIRRFIWDNFARREWVVRPGEIDIRMRLGRKERRWRRYDEGPVLLSLGVSEPDDGDVMLGEANGDPIPLVEVDAESATRLAVLLARETGWPLVAEDDE